MLNRDISTRDNRTAKVRTEISILTAGKYCMCDWACKNPPCEYKKLLIFNLSLLCHNLQTIYTNKIKSLLLQNLMGFLLKFMEMGYLIQS